MFIRRLNDRDFDLGKDYVKSLNYRMCDTFDSFEVLKHAGSKYLYALRGYHSNGRFHVLYYGVTPGACMAAMQIVIDNWDEGNRILDLTESGIKAKLERADFEWLAQFPTYYDLPEDVREHMPRELYDEMQNKIKFSER